VVVDLWFIEKQMEKRNVRLSREGAFRYVLDAKKCYSWKSTSSRNRVPGTIAGVLQSTKLGSLPIEAILKPVIELAERAS
jgi:gamma-glutamyltranspeptidase